MATGMNQKSQAISVAIDLSFSHGGRLSPDLS